MTRLKILTMRYPFVLTSLFLFTSSHFLGIQCTKNVSSAKESVKVSSPNILVLEASSVKSSKEPSKFSPIVSSPSSSSSSSSGSSSIIQQINSRRFGDLRISNILKKPSFGLPLLSSGSSEVPSYSAGSGLPQAFTGGWAAMPSSQSSSAGYGSGIHPDHGNLMVMSGSNPVGGESRLKSLLTSSRLKGNPALTGSSSSNVVSSSEAASSSNHHPILVQLHPGGSSMSSLSTASGSLNGDSTSQLGLGGIGISSSASGSDLGFSASHLPEGVKLSHLHNHESIDSALHNQPQLSIHSVNSDHREHLNQAQLAESSGGASSSSSSSLFSKGISGISPSFMIPRIPRLNVLRPSKQIESILNSHKDHISLSKMIPFLFPYKLSPPSAQPQLAPASSSLMKNKLIPLGIFQGLLKPKFFKTHMNQQQQHEIQSPNDLTAMEQKQITFYLNGQNGQHGQHQIQIQPQAAQNLQMLQQLIQQHQPHNQQPNGHDDDSEYPKANEPILPQDPNSGAPDESSQPQGVSTIQQQHQQQQLQQQSDLQQQFDPKNINYAALASQLNPIINSFLKQQNNNQNGHHQNQHQGHNGFQTIQLQAAASEEKPKTYHEHMLHQQHKQQQLVEAAKSEAIRAAQSIAAQQGLQNPRIKPVQVMQIQLSPPPSLPAASSSHESYQQPTQESRNVQYVYQTVPASGHIQRPIPRPKLRNVVTNSQDGLVVLPSNHGQSVDQRPEIQFVTLPVQDGPQHESGASGEAIEHQAEPGSYEHLVPAGFVSGGPGSIGHHQQQQQEFEQMLHQQHHQPQQHHQRHPFFVPNNAEVTFLQQPQVLGPHPGGQQPVFFSPEGYPQPVDTSAYSGLDTSPSAHYSTLQFNQGGFPGYEMLDQRPAVVNTLVIKEQVHHVPVPHVVHHHQPQHQQEPQPPQRLPYGMRAQGWIPKDASNEWKPGPFRSAYYPPSEYSYLKFTIKDSVTPSPNAIRMTNWSGQLAPIKKTTVEPKIVRAHLVEAEPSIEPLEESHHSVEDPKHVVVTETIDLSTEASSIERKPKVTRPPRVRVTKVSTTVGSTPPEEEYELVSSSTTTSTAAPIISTSEKIVSTPSVTPAPFSTSTKQFIEIKSFEVEDPKPLESLMAAKRHVFERITSLQSTTGSPIAIYSPFVSSESPSVSTPSPVTTSKKPPVLSRRKAVIELSSIDIEVEKPKSTESALDKKVGLVRD